MKIMVTGSNGFVGKALCEFLISKGHDVVPISRTQVGNIDNKTHWKEHIINCDAVIHLAARVHVMNEVSNDPLSAFREVNVGGTLNLAENACASGVKKFIFLSSIKVNGEFTTTTPFKAIDTPNPQDPYGVSKYEAELGLRAIEKKSDMAVVIIRPPLIYGPGVKANFSRLIQIVKKGLPLPLGSVHNLRSMVSLDNLISLINECLENPNAKGNTFLVSDDEDVSTTRLLRLIAEGMEKRPCLIPFPTSIIVFFAKIFGLVSVTDRILGSLQLDIETTKTTLNWKPSLSLKDGINKTVRSFLNQ